MRYFSVGLLVAAAVSPLVACGDDGTGDTPGTTSTGLTVPATPGSDTPADTSSPSTQGTTSDEPTVGGNSLGTESNGTTEGPSPTTGPGQTTGPATTDTTTDTSPDTTTTNNPSDVSASDTDMDTGSTTEEPPPPCMESDCVLMGEYCNPDTGTCDPGCNDDADCGGMTVCDTNTNMCTGCLVDANCPLGTVCSANNCVAGCTDMQPCQQGLACCGGQCFDILSDVDHCGDSCAACPALNNASSECVNGVCGFAACEANFNNCDGDVNNGCETDDSCACTPNMAIPCYTGPDNTAGVGICKMGTQTCNAQGTGYGDCVGEVLPNSEDICSNGLDDNCNNVVDDNPDADGDGFTKCGGDCCDAVGPACLNPELVNPGAFEVMGNMVDDDCDTIKDNPLPACDANLPSNSSDPLQYARAIDLCQFTTENPPQAMKKWGVISGNLQRANGNNTIDAESKSIRANFGTGGIVRQQGSNMAVFSTGNAAAQNHTNPDYADFQGGVDNGLDVPAPADWLAANGGQFPNAPNCPGPGSTTANDSIMLKLRVRVPTNALSFNVQMHFFSAEWPEYVCTTFNDLFVTLVDAPGAPMNPADKNIAIYTTPQNQKYPVGVNIAKAAPGLFTECTNGQIACLGTPSNYNNCTAGAGPLANTGFQVQDSACPFPNNGLTGGGTGWLKMAGNVVPGAVMEIRFVIWDTGDSSWDSLVLLDNWVWLLQASQPGVMPN